MNRARCASLAWAAAALVAAAAACGGTASSLPQPAPCTSPTPLPTSPANPGRTSEQAFRSTLLSGVARLDALNKAWIEKRPGRKISNSATFRADFVAYADAAACLATSLRDLEPPVAKYNAWKVELNAQMDRTVAVMMAGRAAVDSRNASDYRDWNKAIDARGDEIQAVMGAIPPR